MLIDTAILSGAILLIIGTATGMAWALTQSGFSSDLAAYMADLPGGAFTFFCVRSEEHTSELQSLMRISYAVFCLKKNKNNTTVHTYTEHITPRTNKKHKI